MQQRRRRLERVREQRPKARVVARVPTGGGDRLLLLLPPSPRMLLLSLLLLLVFGDEAGHQPVDDGAQVVRRDRQRQLGLGRRPRAVVAGHSGGGGGGAHRRCEQAPHEPLGDGELPAFGHRRCG